MLMRSGIIKMGNDIDTDQIIPSQYLLTTVEDMKQYTFETLLPDFCDRVKSCNIIVAGDNFGCGSSREQAPSVLKALGVQAVIAKSFARIFFRNAVNIGLTVIICESLQDEVSDGQTIEADAESGTIKTDNGGVFDCTALPPHMSEILKAGGLIEYLNERTADTYGHDNK